MVEGTTRERLLYFSLLVTAAFFLRKGVQYLFLGRYIPILVMAPFLVLLLIGLFSSKRLLGVAAKVWATLIVLWASARLFVSAANYVAPVFDEYHLSFQFGLAGLAVSGFMLCLAYAIFKAAGHEAVK
ncbi:MAG: hypothetical protein AAF725_26745 [Acidobacteriota bacterium]